METNRGEPGNDLPRSAVDNNDVQAVMKTNAAKVLRISLLFFTAIYPEAC